MSTMRKNLLLTLGAGLVALTALLAGPAANAAYPDRPITLLVAYGAGGGTDVTARMLAPFIEKYLGEGARIVVLNRPGAGGEIGFAALAEAKADGYTIGFINTPNFVTIPIERTARYNPTAVDPLVNVIDDPGVMVVHNTNAIKSLTDLVDAARNAPNRIAVGTTGIGSDDHLGMLELERAAKIHMLLVPFASDADATRALLGHHIALEAMNLGEALRLRAEQPTRILGLMAAERMPEAPDLQTFKEQGFDVVMAAMRGIAAPKGLPADIRARLVDAITQATQDPEFQAKAKASFQPLRILGPEAYAAELIKADQRFRATWAETPWSAPR